jgi:D-aspartate ligase
MGRVGVPVFAFVEDRLTPTAVSRYLSGRYMQASTGLEPEDVLVERFIEAGRRVGRRSVVIATDDEAAVLLATHARELESWYILPKIDPKLATRLASKQGLQELCMEQGIATPRAAFVSSPADLAEFIEEARFPVVAKSVAPWERLRVGSLRDPSLVRDATELIEASHGWGPSWSVTLQEYLPREVSEDWIFQAYFDKDSQPLVAFTGAKFRSWPPHAGPTAYARVVANERLAKLASELCHEIGYRGIVDMDWRFDRRDDTYKLLDCNPRVGAQFRLFETDTGIDVVRAMHLDLTGRAVPRGRQVDGRAIVVEHYDARAVFAYGRHRADRVRVPHERGRTELSWLALDDPLPAFALGARLVSRLFGRLRPPENAGRPAQSLR